MKKVIVFILVVLAVVLAVFYWWRLEESKHNDEQWSKSYRQSLNVLNEIDILFHDPRNNLDEEIDFIDKQASVEQGSNTTHYEIIDFLEPFNLDNQGEEEWPVIMQADYQDGSQTSYLAVLRQQDNKFMTVDSVELGDPNKLDNAHSYRDREIIVEVNISSKTGKEKAFLTFYLQDNKLIPGEHNLSLEEINSPTGEKSPIGGESENGDISKRDDQETNANSDNQGSDEPTSAQKIALTFDDGPNVHTPEVLDALADKGVRATFFMIGENVASYPDYAKRVHDEGHEIGNHTWDHPQLTQYSKDGQKEEMTKTLDQLHSIIPNLSVPWFRPPYMNYNDDTKQAAADLGMRIVLWNVDTRDWSGLPVEEIINGAVGPAQDQSIILMHDGVANSGATAAALPSIIDNLRDQGFALVKVSELDNIVGTD